MGHFRVISCNVNGLRSAISKGFFDWLALQQADVICLQEIRLHGTQLDSRFHLRGYEGYFCCADKKGYSGVAIYTRHRPESIVRQLGWEVADQEGRYLQLNFNRVSIISLYLPSGTSGSERQQYKMNFLKCYQPILQSQIEKEREYILCGDWNIAHQPIDLKNWKANQKNSGFLPEERAWLDTILGSMGYLDAFRVLEPGEGHYTWWSNRGRAREKNVGWRIDYQLITPNLKQYLSSAAIYKMQYFSDHAPLTIDYSIEFF